MENVKTVAELKAELAAARAAERELTKAHVAALKEDARRTAKATKAAERELVAAWEAALKEDARRTAKAEKAVAKDAAKTADKAARAAARAAERELNAAHKEALKMNAAFDRAAAKAAEAATKEQAAQMFAEAKAAMLALLAEKGLTVKEVRKLLRETEAA